MMMMVHFIIFIILCQIKRIHNNTSFFLRRRYYYCYYLHIFYIFNKATTIYNEMFLYIILSIRPTKKASKTRSTFYDMLKTSHVNGRCAAYALSQVYSHYTVFFLKDAYFFDDLACLFSLITGRGQEKNFREKINPRDTWKQFTFLQCPSQVRRRRRCGKRSQRARSSNQKFINNFPCVCAAVCWLARSSCDFSLENPLRNVSSLCEGYGNVFDVASVVIVV